MKPAADPVDRKELAKAIAAIDTAKELSSKHREELSAMQQQIDDYSTEITKLHSLVREFDVGNDPLGIVDVKNFVRMKLQAKEELEILSGIKEKLEKNYRDSLRSYAYNDAESERNAVRDCWSVLYTSFLSVFDAQALKELIVIGCAAGMNQRMVTENVGLHEYIDHDLMRPIAKKYGIPIYGEVNE